MNQIGLWRTFIDVKHSNTSMDDIPTIAKYNSLNALWTSIFKGLDGFKDTNGMKIKRQFLIVFGTTTKAIMVLFAHLFLDFMLFHLGKMVPSGICGTLIVVTGISNLEDP